MILLAVMLDDEVLRKAVRRGRDEPQALAGPPDGDEFKPACFRFGGDGLAALAVDINDSPGARRQQFTEQAELLREIIVEARVIVQMVARDIGEGAGGKCDAVDAALLQAVARGLEGKMGDAVLGESGKDRMKLDRVRRRVLQRFAFRAVPPRRPCRGSRRETPLPSRAGARRRRPRSCRWCR